MGSVPSSKERNFAKWEVFTEKKGRAKDRLVRARIIFSLLWGKAKARAFIRRVRSCLRGIGRAQVTGDLMENLRLVDEGYISGRSGIKPRFGAMGF